MSRSFNLYRLQQVDLKLDQMRTRLVEINALLAEDAAFRAAQAAVEKHQSVLDSAHKALSTAEQNTRAQRIKIEQTENHLYSGRVVNPKELQDLQNEVAALKRYLDTLEERQLEVMMTADSADSDFQDASTTLENAKADQIANNAALNGEQIGLVEDIKRLESERMVSVNAVPADDRALYDRLRTKLRGVAVASASNRSCAACGTTFSAALYQAARSPAKLTFCDTCGRILYAE